jgi:hypothetical protein
MLEALITRDGDILVVKKKPCIWSKREREEFFVVDLKDAKLEATMKIDPVAYPYPIIESVETPIGTISVTTGISKFVVDVANLPAQLDVDTLTAKPSL